MGLLSALTGGLVRGGRRMAVTSTKRGPKMMNKGGPAKPTGVLISSRKFLKVKEMVPEFVVPSLEGFKLKPYVSYRTPEGTEPVLTPEALFSQAVAPQIKKDFEEGTFSPDQLEKYGFEPTQDGKLFKLYPKNFVR
ncbi:large ribosomal subunit protein mL41 [Conger conger]|uniref:large ribosomal subunit protein mL41 n=1 Tax=Conger conger TaxID=82655 RepID=UPI002A5AE76A|nr:large ribosomal subunit protein mL41 [Conger conger]XP_061115372.1 large ribosomal subunit protein mL41 [Conger conger]